MAGGAEAPLFSYPCVPCDGGRRGGLFARAMARRTAAVGRCAASSPVASRESEARRAPRRRRRRRWRGRWSRRGRTPSSARRPPCSRASTAPAAASRPSCSRRAPPRPRPRPLSPPHYALPPPSPPWAAAASVRTESRLAGDRAPPPSIHLCPRPSSPAWPAAAPVPPSGRQFARIARKAPCSPRPPALPALDSHQPLPSALSRSPGVPRSDPPDSTAAPERGPVARRGRAGVRADDAAAARGRAGDDGAGGALAHAVQHRLHLPARRRQRGEQQPPRHPPQELRLHRQGDPPPAPTPPCTALWFNTRPAFARQPPRPPRLRSQAHLSTPLSQHFPACAHY